MIDISLRIAAMLGACAAIGGAVIEFGHHERAIGRQEVQAKWDAEKLATQSVVIRRAADVATIDQQQDEKASKVDTHVQEQLKIVAADRDRAVSAAAGLRAQLSAVRADAMSETATRSRLAAELATTTDSLGECSGRYSEVAEQSDRLSVQVSGLIQLAPSE